VGSETTTMQVLKILSDIWKSGADIFLDKSDDRVAIKNQKLIPADVMKVAEQNFKEIDDWFKSWNSESPERITLMKIIHQYCGWQHNQKLFDWLNTDEESLLLFYDWSCVLAENRWTDLYEDYRKFENEKSNGMAQELYKRAVTYAKKGAGK
jgi:hypothetical protein